MATKIIAHRGYHHTYVENTLEAFHAALDHGADGIELDVHYAKDGEIMVYHDFDLMRLANLPHQVASLTKAELQQIKLLGSGCMPTLESVLQLIVSHQEKTKKPILLNVEIKAGSRIYPQIEKRTALLCEEYLERSQVIYSSFDHHALYTLKEINSAIKTGVLTASSLFEPWHYCQRLRADYYHGHIMTLDETEINAIHHHNLALNPYTVNDIHQAKNLLTLNVHGLITDNLPEMLTLRKKAFGLGQNGGQDETQL